MKNTKLLLAFILLLSSQAAYTQSPIWQWAQSAYDNRGADPAAICTDASGNSFVIGSFIDTLIFGNTILKNPIHNGNPNTFLVKYDASGTVQWAKSFRGTVNSPGSLTTDSHGNLYVSESIGITAIIDTDTLQSGSYLIKFTTSGSIAWVRTAIAETMAFDASDNVFLAGIFTDSLVYNNTTLAYADQTSLYLIKTDTAGHELWFKTGIHHSQNSVGTGGIKLAIGSDGSCAIGSDFGYGVPTGHDTLSFDQTYLIDTSTNPVGSLNTFVAKYNSGGSLLWARQSEGNGFASITGLSTDDANGVFISGNFGGGDVGFGPITLHEFTNTQTQNNGFALHYDSTGHEAWAVSMTGPTSYTNSIGIAADGHGNAYVAGNWSDTLHLGSDTALYMSPTGSASFLAKYDATGHVTHVEQIGQRSTLFGEMSRGTNNAIFITGTSSDTNVSFGMTTLLQPTGWHSGQSSFFIAKFMPGSSSIDAIEAATNTISLYPNPAHDAVTIAIDQKWIGSQCTITDMLGKEMLRTKLTHLDTTLTIQELSSGIYLVNIAGSTFKLIKE